MVGKSEVCSLAPGRKPTWLGLGIGNLPWVPRPSPTLKKASYSGLEHSLVGEHVHTPYAVSTPDSHELSFPVATSLDF